jgi:hypothetical protein
MPMTTAMNGSNISKRLSIKLESAEFLRLSHGLILAFVSADPVLGNPIRLA